FRFDLLATLKGQNRIIKHELCSALKILESVIRHIADSNVHYRMLMAVNIFKNVKDKISDGERDQAKAGLFPSPDSYVEDTTKLVAEVIAQIRSIVGMKQLHEAIAFSWNVARSSNKSPDPVIVGSAEQIPKGKPSEVTENVINLTLSALELPSFSHMIGEGTSRICSLDELQWSNSEVEQSFETSDSPVLDELCEEPPLEVEEVSSLSFFKYKATAGKKKTVQKVWMSIITSEIREHFCSIVLISSANRICIWMISPVLMPL
ncbi:hypothetical protein OSTOST_17143, partial [Ostertagia ostertagi]